ncbi:MAG: hypothetical protein IT561_03865 [Alphaproteobacteria bacterium]|nr:hypothetical protein [Alphaproteobacteria bacterium]
MVGRWLLGGIVGIIGIIGLFLAATVHTPGFYTFGLLLAGAAVVYIFAMIKRSFDELER